MNSAAAITVAALAFGFILVVISQQAPHSALQATPFHSALDDQGNLSAATGTTTGAGLNQIVYTAVSLAVGCVSAAGLAFVIRRGNFL